MEIEDGTLAAAAKAFTALGDVAEEPIVHDLEDDDDLGNEGVDEESEIGDDAAAAEDETEAADEQDDEAPAPIDPPVSWDAEAKARFAKLPPDDQRYIAERESQRDRFIQAKATEAAETRKSLDTVTEQHTQLHRQYAEQLENYAKAFDPQQPDPSLIATNPGEYAAQLAEFQQLTAYRQQLAQQAEQANQQARQIEEQRLKAVQAAEDAELIAAIPEYANPAQRGPILQQFIDDAKALGYQDQQLRGARPVDILAVRKAAEWKSKAEKYDALQGQRMEAVRAAKGKPRVATPGTAQPKGSARAQQYSESMSRLHKSGELRDAVAAFKNMR